MSLSFGVLGPLWAEDAHGRLALKGPRHRAVLARLLVARGRVVPVTRLIDDLWEDPPENATGTIHTFVAALRRILEPDRPPRRPARVLVTEPPGYVLRIEPDQVDAERFEQAVRHAGISLEAGRAAEAVAELDAALALWHGPAYAEFAEFAWVRAEIARLDEQRLVAVEQRARALLAVGRTSDAVVAMEALLHDHPLREQAWYLLASALYRGGRQADALEVLRTVRTRLRDELAIEPGPELRELESAILAQAPHLQGASIPAKTVGAVSVSNPSSRVEGTAVAGPFVGRVAELARLNEAATEVLASARPRLVLISGMEGAGKSALAAAFVASLAQREWATAWGPSPEDGGTPPNWAWQRIVADLASAGHSHGPATSARADSVRVAAADPAVERFEMRRAAVEYLASVARGGPVSLVLDDLHQAGEETLELVSALVTGPVDGAVLVIGTYRDTDVGAGLAAALARWARVEPVRIQLGGLTEGETGELVGAVSGVEMDSAVVRRIHRRGNGNPFFTRELARLLRDEGEDALGEVPVGVRDVVRQRVARLSEAERTVLARAAVLGEGIDREVLTELAGDAGAVLDAAEAGVRAGFLVESDSGELSFAHAVVRDVLYREISGPRRAAWHAAVGELLEEAGGSDPAVLAHHFVRANGRATAARAARYSVEAGRAAERVFAPHEAARWFAAAVTAYERDGDIRGRLEATMGFGRASALTGALAESRRVRAQALRDIDTLDDPELAARVLAAFDVPALWTDTDDPRLAVRVVAVAEHTLRALPADALELRSRLLTTIALEVRAADGERGRAAAIEAEELARRLNDPALLAFALNARFMQTFHRAGLAPERARIATEIIELSRTHELVTFEVLGHLIAVQSHSAMGDFAAADQHAAAAGTLGDTYGLTLVAVFTRWYSALRQSMSAPYDVSESTYRAAAAAVPSAAMPGLEHGLLPLALLCLRLRHELPLDVDPALDWGPHEPWVRPLLLLAQGREDEARTALRALPSPPPGLLLELRLCLVARAASALDERAIMSEVRDRLRLAASELAGAGTGLVTLEPVADYLERLDTALD